MAATEFLPEVSPTRPAERVREAVSDVLPIREPEPEIQEAFFKLARNLGEFSFIGFNNSRRHMQEEIASGVRHRIDLLVYDALKTVPRYKRWIDLGMKRIGYIDAPPRTPDSKL